MSADTVRAVGQAYGYPNVDHLAWGVDELTKDLVAEQHQQARRARIAALPAHPSAPLPSRRGRPGRTPSAPAGRTSAHPGAPRPAAMLTPVNTERRPYVAALRAGQLFTDATYQRPLDPARVRRMRAESDTALLGIVDVSARGDGRYALVDGQHRWAAVKAQHGDQAPIACNVHTGLSVEQEAELFFQIDRSRRRLTGWDRWWARHGSAEQAVLAIERTVAAHQLRVGAATRDGSVRATKALRTSSPSTAPDCSTALSVSSPPPGDGPPPPSTASTSTAWPWSCTTTTCRLSSTPTGSSPRCRTSHPGRSKPAPVSCVRSARGSCPASSRP